VSGRRPSVESPYPAQGLIVQVQQPHLGTIWLDSSLLRLFANRETMATYPRAEGFFGEKPLLVVLAFFRAGYL